jgi:hypothetical protein
METGRDADPPGEECLGKIKSSCLVFGFVLAGFLLLVQHVSALVGMWKSLPFSLRDFQVRRTVEKSP